MFTINDNNISLTRGDSLFLTVDLVDSDGDPYVPSEGDSIRFAMKRRMNSPDLVMLKEIPTDTLTFEIEPEETKELKYATYVYDIELTDADGHVATVIIGKFTVTEEVY